METIWIDGQFKKVPNASVVVINNIGTGGGGSFDESILEKYALKEDIKSLLAKDEEIDINKDAITVNSKLINENAKLINELDAGIDAINAKLEEEDHVVENGILKIS